MFWKHYGPTDESKMSSKPWVPNEAGTPPGNLRGRGKWSCPVSVRVKRTWGSGDEEEPGWLLTSRPEGRDR